MAHQDSGWRPKGVSDTYNGFEVWDHGVWPTDLNYGEQDGDISFSTEESDDA